jgi:ferredoxin
MKILYLTSTGNCLYIAKRIGGELLSIPQLQKESIYDITDDVVGIIVPIYCFDIPRIAKNYLRKANIKAEYVFAVMTYGNLSMAALGQMKILLESRNVFLNYSNEIKMVDNYLPGFEMVDQLQKQNNGKTEMKIDTIINDIKERKCSLVKHNLFQKYMSKKYSKYYMEGQGNFNKNTAAKSFIVDHNCNECGTCRKVCPMNNIICKDNKPEYQNNCEFCLACIHICPQNAIHLEKEKSNKRFINPHVKISEIINANKQT